METDQRRFGERVVFERGYNVHIRAIDGNWRCACSILDVSEDAARIVIEGSIVDPALKEFFLLLSSPWLGGPSIYSTRMRLASSTARISVS